ncbi:MAG: hypothetical protein ACK2UL_08380 [Anaerolineae bacterium]
MRKLVLPLALIAVFALVFVGAAAAQDAQITTVNGQFVGDRGGSHVEYTAAMPQNTDVSVSVEYSPCGDASALPLVVYANDGQVIHGYEDGHCRKTAAWNSAGGTEATVKFSNYLHGVALYYVLTAEGFNVETATMTTVTEPVMAEEAAMETEEEATETEEVAMAEEEEAEGEGIDAVAVAEKVFAAGEAVGMLEANATTGEVLGTNGGGHSKYQIELMGGKPYGAIMSYAMDVGGTWPAVNFKVWGPSGGVVAAGVPSQHGNLRTVDFVAPEDGVYTVDVYNYHSGHTAYYTITGMPLPAGMSMEEEVVTEVEEPAMVEEEDEG